MDSQVFDYVVVGAGSAGSVLASRLSADPKHRVLVLEAGRESHPWSRIPVGFARLIQNPAANWLYASEPDDGTGQRRIPVPRGKLLGGSSSINGMVFVRGQSQDYDTWAQLGNRGWSYREVLPIFNIESDDELLHWVRNNAETTYHPVGTCKMGSDPMAVVDDQLRVRGIENLRVADASIMPTLTSGNTNAPSIMIGEKASRMILAAA